MSSWVERWWLSTCCFYRGLQVLFSAPTWLLTTSVIPGPGDLMPSPGLFGYYIHMMHLPCTQAKHTHIHKKKQIFKISIWKISSPQSELLDRSWVLFLWCDTILANISPYSAMSFVQDLSEMQFCTLAMEGWKLCKNHENSFALPVPALDCADSGLY